MRPDILTPLFCSIECLKGIGAKYLKLVSGLVGGGKVVDILWHFPYNLIDRTYTCPIRNIEAGKIWTGVVRVATHLPPQTKKQPYRVICEDETGEITLNFFKFYKDSIQKQLPLGSKKLISGKTEWFNGQIQMSHPDYISDERASEKVGGIEPVYPLCGGVTNKMMRWYVSQSLQRVPDLPEWDEPNFMKAQNFPSFKEALNKVHNPLKETDLSPLSACRKRLAYDELLANQLTLALARNYHRKKEGRVFKGNGVLRKKLLDILGFELTGAQQRALEDILRDQSLPYQGLRLVQGNHFLLEWGLQLFLVPKK